MPGLTGSIPAPCAFSYGFWLYHRQQKLYIGGYQQNEDGPYHKADPGTFMPGSALSLY